MRNVLVPAAISFCLYAIPPVIGIALTAFLEIESLANLDWRIHVLKHTSVQIDCLNFPFVRNFGTNFFVCFPGVNDFWIECIGSKLCNCCFDAQFSRICRCSSAVLQKPYAQQFFWDAYANALAYVRYTMERVAVVNPVQLQGIQYPSVLGITGVCDGYGVYLFRHCSQSEMPTNMVNNNQS